MQIVSFGTKYDVKVRCSKYEYLDNLFVGLDYFDEDFGCFLPYGNLTVNVEKLPYGCACLDVNNFPQAVEFVEKYGLAKDTGRFVRSGYCSYPVYKFDMEKMKQYMEVE